MVRPDKVPSNRGPLRGLAPCSGIEEPLPFTCPAIGKLFLGKMFLDFQNLILHNNKSHTLARLCLYLEAQVNQTDRQ